MFKKRTILLSCGIGLVHFLVSIAIWYYIAMCIVGSLGSSAGGKVIEYSALALWFPVGSIAGIYEKSYFFSADHITSIRFPVVLFVNSMLWALAAGRIGSWISYRKRE